MGRFVLAAILAAGAIGGFGSAFSGFCKGGSSHCHRSAEPTQAPSE